MVASGQWGHCPRGRGATYIVDDYVTYSIDNEGRVNKITAILRTGPNDRRDSKLQAQANGSDRGGRGAPSDNGGHMIAARFNGPVELINYHAQNSTINKPGGQWYAMEQEWANNITAGVRVEITPLFNGSKRPFQFDIKYWYNGQAQLVPNSNPVRFIFEISNP